MRIPRIYIKETLTINTAITIKNDIAHYLIRVLRVKINDQLIIFNGNDSFEYLVTITHINKKSLDINVKEIINVNTDSPLKIHLGQSLTKGDKFDLVVQKTTELGISAVTPLFSHRSEYKLSKERFAKKISHWQKIAISAAEQSGRTSIPTIIPPIPLKEWLQQKHQNGIVLNPSANTQLTSFANQNMQAISILIGPEGGLTEAEIKLAQSRDFKSICLGPRILRTETAPISIISIAQSLWGDF